MSIETIPGQGVNDQSNPNSYIDAKSGAIVAVAGQEGISGWIFDIPTGESISLSSDITDHYTENGSFISDHIVNKPIEITLSGLIGELKYEFPQSGIEQNISEVTNALGIVPAYLGPLTPGATQKVTGLLQTASYAVSQFEALKKRVENLKSLADGADATETLQQKAFAEIRAMRDSKQIVSVQTPWAFFPSMAIQSITARQDEGSTDITDFSVTLKELRFADVQVTEFDENEYRSAIEVQSTPPASVGEVQGQQRNSSLLFNIFGGG